MNAGIPQLPPEEIERRSFAIIEAELGETDISPENFPVARRVIHATADFDFARILHFSDGAVAAGVKALVDGRPIVTDTRMALAGINKPALARLGCAAHCHIADDDVATAAKAAGCTRSRAAMDKAVSLWGDAVYVVGNAPTALIRLCELMAAGAVRPGLVVGVPVGFVHVEESKELLVRSGAPCIASMGRKGGSTVAAAICNALLIMAEEAKEGGKKTLAENPARHENENRDGGGDHDP